MHDYPEFDPKSSLRRRRLAAAAVIVALAAFTIALVYTQFIAATSRGGKAQTREMYGIFDLELKETSAPSSVTPAVFEAGRRSVYLMVERPGDDNDDSYGSGFLFSDNTVVTAAHVVKGNPTRIMVGCGGRVVDGEVVFRDVRRDTAVVRTSGCPATEPLRLADEPPKGDTKLTIVAHNFNNSVSNVTWRCFLQTRALERGKEKVKTLSNSGTRLLGLRGLATHGNSGAAVVNEDGEVVGMASFIAYYQNATYAISAAELKTALKEARVL